MKLNDKWREPCKSCGRSHIVELQNCISCGVHQTPQPVSEVVKDDCHADYDCDGCQAYSEHQI